MCSTKVVLKRLIMNYDFSISLCCLASCYLRSRYSVACEAVVDVRGIAGVSGLDVSRNLGSRRQSL